MEKYTECIGCGYCCAKTQCVAGIDKFGTSHQPCLGLVWDEEAGRHWCRLGLGSDQSAFFYRQALYMGAGCSSAMFNEWRTDLKDRTKVLFDRPFQSPIPAIMQIFLRSLGRQFITGDCIELMLSDFNTSLLKQDYEEETIRIYIKWIKKYITENRSSFSTEFMG